MDPPSLIASAIWSSDPVYCVLHQKLLADSNQLPAVIHGGTPECRSREHGALVGRVSMIRLCPGQEAC